MEYGIIFKRATARSIFLALLFLTTSLGAQTRTSGVSSDGRDFFIGSVFPSFNRNTNFTFGNPLPLYKTYALITGYRDCIAYISYFDAKTGMESVSQPVRIFAQQGVAISLDSLKLHLTEPGDIPEFKSCHITADGPVNVQFFSTGANSGGSYLALATNALGKNYAIPSYNDNPGYGAGQSSHAENSAGFFEIIAPFDTTTVTITPNTTTAGGHIGVSSGRGANGQKHPYSVTLMRGQCYWVKGDSQDDNNDISGSIVVADKPIVVLAGHEDAFIGETPSNSALDGRDFMIEQVIPSEFWDTTGYVSIPLVGAQPVDESATGYGQNYRVFTNNPKGARIEENDCLRGQNDMSTAPYNAYPPQRNQVGCPIEFHSTDGHKFGVMCYEQREQGTKDPFPTESMMTIVPMSSWKKSYMIYVPANPFETLQDYFVNIIGEPNDMNNIILYSHNGGNFTRLTSLTSYGSYANIPNYPGLKGFRFKVTPGSYYFINPRTKLDSTSTIDTILHGAFMVYNYGMRAVDAKMALGDLDGDDFFFSYANPAGASLSSGDPGNFTVTIDSMCGKWHVCVQDNRINDPGIRSISLLNDPNASQYYPGKVNNNCHFDPLLDQSNIGEVELPGTSNKACFDVLVSRPIDSALAEILVTDNAGNLKLIELRYAPAKFALSPAAPVLLFSNTILGTDSCITVHLKNTASVPQNILSATLDTLGGFSLTSVTPVLPVQLQSGDSIVMKICFFPHANGSFADTVKVNMDCLVLPIPLAGTAGSGLISATDLGFGRVDTGKTASDVITISNVGTRAFTLMTNPFITGSQAFSITPLLVPIALGSNATQTITIHYAPKTVGKDSAVIHWLTDIAAPNTQSVKSFSNLSGEGIAVPSSVSMQPKPATLSIHPNPAGGSSIILTLGSMSGEAAEIHILDLLGREMFRKNIPIGGKDTQQLEIPIGNLQNGIYYARVTSGGKTMTEKFEVMR